MLSALLFLPSNATPENPAPGIVTSHGWYNNREMQDLNFGVNPNTAGEKRESPTFYRKRIGGENPYLAGFIWSFSIR